MSKKTLIIFTASYPWSIAQESTFISPELEYHKANFDCIVFVPSVMEGEKEKLSSSIKVEEGFAIELAKYKKLNNKLRELLSFSCISLVISELISRPTIIFSYRKIKRLLLYALFAKVTARWGETFINSTEIVPEHSVFYTYWPNFYTLGLGIVKEQFPEFSLISRALGFFIYEERHTPPYLPLRRKTLEKLDRYYLVSQDALDYICNKFPEMKTRCKLLRLYVKGKSKRSYPSEDGFCRIVSCSGVIPVKRILLMYEGIKQFAFKRSDFQVEWRHFGEGSQMKELLEMVKSAPSNLKCLLPGYVKNYDVMNYYQENLVDIFINTSCSEGTPVGIMEALSFGMPVIATAVGGNKEVVSERNGVLLNANPEAVEIADAILEIISDKKKMEAKRNEAYKLWSEEFNADVKYPEFSREIRSLIDSKTVL